jgi:WD40 repeat protein
MGTTVVSEAYDVFVSYSRLDGRHAAEIDSILRAKGLKPFFDRRNLAPGLPWVRALEQAIGAAKAAIVLIGPHGLGNVQQYERDLAIWRQTRDPSFPIVPVILPDAEIDRPYNFLQILTWIDFSHVAKVSDAPSELERLVAAVRCEQQISSAESVQHAICPYRGLDAFREEDSLFFFGRGTADDPQSAIGQLVRKVRDYPFVMVVGRSGSGKSSLVYAGLVPALRRARDRFWNVLTLRPGSEPIEALAKTFNPQADGEGNVKYAEKIGDEADRLRKGAPELLSRMIRQELDRSEGKPDRLLLYIDQWEELYTQASQSVENDRASRHIADVNRFIDLLLNAAQTAPVSVVATVRADFYDPLISHQKIQALLPTQQVLLGLMSRADLESTIVEPAKMVGLTFDPPSLVSQILEASEDEGMLPLLQYALKETWALRVGSVMTGDAYARTGGVREAIRLTAERTFTDLSADDRQAARRLFLRLVTPGEGQEDTRARAAMPDEPALRKIVDQFAGPRTRLLVTDRPTGSENMARPTVEVAHEALIRTWPRLREWVDANRDKLRARAAILQSKAEWERNSRREDLLLPAGFQLERARLLVADPGDIAIDDIKEFIAESEAADAKRRSEDEAREHERQAAELHAAHQLAAASRRVARRTLAGLAAALVLALIAVGTGIYARIQTADAVSQRAEAELQRKEAERQKTVAQYQASEAVRQGAEAVRQKAEAEKQAGLAEANFREAQKTESHFRAEQAKQAGADVVTAALLALEGLPDPTASDEAQRTRPFVNEVWSALYSARLGERERAIMSGHTGAVYSAVFAPDGGRILTASDDGTARLWDCDGKPIATLEGHTDAVRRAVFVPDGGRILTASDDGTARLWDRDGKQLAVLDGHTGIVLSAVFAPDGDRILTASEDKTARLWDRDGRPLAVLEGHTGWVYSAVFAPDGGRILTASDDNTARLWDRDGKLLAVLEGHAGPIRSAVFAPDDDRILTASADKTARLWDRDGKPLAVLEGHTSWVTGAVFAPDGGRILTASEDKTARLWDRDGKPLAVLDGHAGPIRSAVFAPDGGGILTASEDKTARLWDRDGKPLAVLEGHTGRVTGAAFAPDGGGMLTASADKTARLWDRDGKPLAVLEGHKKNDRVISAAFAPDGGDILTASADKTARLWDRDGKPLAVLEGHTHAVVGAVFSPDGSRILTASLDGTSQLWDRDGEPLAILQGHTGGVYRAVFSPDGSRILTASADKTARLWDRDGKQLAVLEGHTGRVYRAVFAPDGDRILTASEDTTARLWDRNGKRLAVLDGHTDIVLSAVFAPDGDRILTASEDQTARLWDRDGKPLAVLKGHTDEVNGAVFAPDGDRILTASWDSTARLWDRDGKPLAVLEGHNQGLNGAVFAPDGDRILTASEDKTARLWDRDGKQLAVLEGHTGGVYRAVFSPDGSRILTASDDGTARLWEAFPQTQTLVDRVKAEVPRCLTPAQRHHLFLAPTPPSWCIEMHKWPYDGATP